MEKQYKRPLCSEQPSDCSFSLIEYEQEKLFHRQKTMAHCLIYCRKGYLRITSNLFAEEILCEGEMMFLPRMNDYKGVVFSDTELLVHEFNNTVCHPEQCILSYLYTHAKLPAGKLLYHCKLTVCEPMISLFNTTILYIKDGKSDYSVWKTKHIELIWIFTHYYQREELRSFFHPMTDEQVPFKSLVLSHYRKAEYTDVLAEMCGYPLHTFRRIFKKEFGMSAHKWLTLKRAEHIKYKLSLPHIPLADIIEEFNFSSHQQFNRFCKEYLGDTPSDIRKKCIDNTEKNVSVQK